MSEWNCLDRMAAAYAFICRFKQEHDGNSPTIRQIGAAIGVPSTSLTDYYLRRLEERGLIDRPSLGGARMILVRGGSWRLSPAREVSHDG